MPFILLVISYLWKQPYFHKKVMYTNADKEVQAQHDILLNIFAFLSVYH